VTDPSGLRPPAGPQDAPRDDDAPRRLGRRALLSGGLTLAAGAGAGAAAGALVARDDPSHRLATGTVAGGGGPWRYVSPGASIQAAIDAGAAAIQLGAGTYPIDAPLAPTPGCTIRGIGEQTVLTATAEVPTVIAIGAGRPVGGVTIADLVVDAASRADTGIDLDIVGTGGNLRGEPDAVCRLDALWVLDARVDGIAYRGSDTQATITSRVRVRRAGRHGYRIEAPDNTWIACEATTQGTGGAGFWVAGANLHFDACKAWYCRGVGWEVRGSRNSFTGCESQDTASHGWRITTARNTLTSCSADTAGMADVGGRPDVADGFSVEPDSELALVGCMAFDRTPMQLPAQQRYGFDVPAALVDAGLLVAPIGWGNVRGLVSAR